jgi:hypothetical protein
MENTEVLDQPITATAELSLTDQLQELITKRTGEFEIQISYKDLKYIKNTLVQKIEWTGSNEAYLLILTVLSIDSCLEEMDPKNEFSRVKISLPSSSLETINYFFSKVTGKGVDSAQKLFSAAMQLRPALEELKKLDEAIQSLREDIAASK